MNSIHSLLISNVVLAALLAVLAIVLTRVWRNPQFAHALWLLVLVKLVTPPLIHVPMPEFAFGSGEHAIDAVDGESDDSDELSRFAGPIATRESMVEETSSVEPLSEPLKPEVVARSATQARRPKTSALTFWQLFLSHWPECLLILSGVGTLVLTCVAFRGHRQLLSLFAAARAPDTTLIDDVKQVSRQIGLASCPPVRVTDALVCPLVSIGRWKQLVLLPSHLLAELSREQIRSILAHELAHIRRRDHWVRCFELIVLALFWWNPIAWWASRKLRQAEEECCDAWVVWALPECRRSYGQALLRTVEILTEGRMIAPIVGAGFGQHMFKKRIEMIMKKRMHHRMPWLARAAILVLGVTVLPLAAAAVSDEPQQDSVQPKGVEIGPRISELPVRKEANDHVAIKSEKSGGRRPVESEGGRKPGERSVLEAGQDAERQVAQDRVNWVVKCIKDFKAIKVGMIRKDVEKRFQYDRGIQGALRGRFIHPDCSIFKMDVEFSVKRDRYNEDVYYFSPDDKVVKVSKPYIARVAAAAHKSKTDRENWVGIGIEDFKAIKVGMTRKEIETRFQHDGGIIGFSSGRFVHPDYPLKINVEFSVKRNPQDRISAFGSPDDKVTKVLNPYIQNLFFD
ncbi:MAG: M56 family metallopeptidase [Planctomycetes bacterium]|nr:M56 family metallopeptidase [Planctomycetota bacterium]